MDLQQHFAEICRKNGWKNTPQRWNVFQIIYENLNHPSVDFVWEEAKKQVPAITRESVYRILNEFAEKGLIRRLDSFASARYDYQTTPHGHFMCRVCGKVTDFPLPCDISYPADVDPASLQHVELRLVGTCRECRKKIRQTNAGNGTNNNG